MQIQDFFINGDMKGAIAYMREHEEFQDILPAYIAIFENCEYRTYDVPDAEEELLTKQLQSVFEAKGYHALFGKPQGFSWAGV